MNEAGETAVLRGFSTHGLTWYPDYVNPDLFEDLSVNWNCNIVRLAMYSEDYLKDKEENLRILHTGIEAALKADLYVLVDWHILNDSNPLQNMKEAEVFFDEISKEYAGVPNILYEICNEPNGDTGWDDIYTYAETITPIIRKNSPDAVIIVGTPEYDADLTSPAAKRLSDPNTMYTFHFYTASHHDEMMERLDTALKAGLPVFITECGITEAHGIERIWSIFEQQRLLP
ncbi:MAG: glycoside hydrolase family 5 protein [Solobacterium sp.]|nr:glycoside hydrolase family 5 protein [Solobacterium sp.]